MSADWSGVDPDADPDLDPDSDCTGKYAFGDSLNERRGNEAMVTWLKAILIPILIFVVVVVKLALDGSWNEEQSTLPIGPFRQPINTPPLPRVPSDPSSSSGALPSADKRKDPSGIANGKLWP